MVDHEILHVMNSGEIVISPFNEENLNTNSYDVRLGEWYYREQHPSKYPPIYNPFDFEQTKIAWGKPCQSVGEILLAPGENILAHTDEFIGGVNCIVTEMHARSSIGRNFLTVCRCAGYGDVGYINRWTMEITNNSRHHHILLKVGMRIAQIQFTYVTPTTNYKGKYQKDSIDLKKIQATWKPEMMLPRLDKDRELVGIVK